MKLKCSIIFTSLSMLFGFIPLSLKASYDIKYTIQSSSFFKVNEIKEELVDFYLNDLYDAKYENIEKNIKKKLSLFTYEAYYKDHIIYVIDQSGISLQGTLYEKYDLKLIKTNYFFK